MKSETGLRQCASAQVPHCSSRFKKLSSQELLSSQGHGDVGWPRSTYPKGPRSQVGHLAATSNRDFAGPWGSPPAARSLGMGQLAVRLGKCPLGWLSMPILLTEGWNQERQGRGTRTGADGETPDSSTESGSDRIAESDDCRLGQAARSSSRAQLSRPRSGLPRGERSPCRQLTAPAEAGPGAGVAQGHHFTSRRIGTQNKDETTSVDPESTPKKANKGI